MEITNISEAKASLSQLIKRVQTTDEPIIIGKAGKPVAVLSPYRADTTVRKLGGSWEGKVEISEGFDALDSSIENSFYKASVFPENE